MHLNHISHDEEVHANNLRFLIFFLNIWNDILELQGQTNNMTFIFTNSVQIYIYVCYESTCSRKFYHISLISTRFNLSKHRLIEYDKKNLYKKRGGGS